MRFLRWLLQFLVFPDMTGHKNAKKSMPLYVIISASKNQGKLGGMHFEAIIFSTSRRDDACRIFHANICSLKTHKSLIVPCREGNLSWSWWLRQGALAKTPWQLRQTQESASCGPIGCGKGGCENSLQKIFHTFFDCVMVWMFVSPQIHMSKP